MGDNCNLINSTAKNVCGGMVLKIKVKMLVQHSKDKSHVSTHVCRELWLASQPSSSYRRVPPHSRLLHCTPAGMQWIVDEVGRGNSSALSLHDNVNKVCKWVIITIFWPTSQVHNMQLLVYFSGLEHLKKYKNISQL